MSATTVKSASIRDIAIAVAEELNLSATEAMSVTEIKVSVTYKKDQEAADPWDDDAWLDAWYQQLVEEGRISEEDMRCLY